MLHGARGGLVVGGLFLIPSVLLVLLLSALFLLAGQEGPFSHLFWALKPVVLALVIQACWRMARCTLRGPAAVAIAALTWLGFSGLGLPPLPLPLPLSQYLLIPILIRVAWPRVAAAQ